LSELPNLESTVKINEFNDLVLNKTLISQNIESMTQSTITDEIINANKLYEDKKIF
jgi:hypothetical protein